MAMSSQSTSHLGSTTVNISAGGARWRRNAELLDQYLRRQMKDAETERKRVYPKTWDTQIQRTVPLIWRIARELSTLYLRAPERRFVGATDAQVVAISALYKRLKVNRRLKTAQQKLSVVCNATVWVWLTSTGFRLLVPPIHDQWAWSNRVDGQDVGDVTEWRIRMPVVHDPFATSSPTAIALITPSRAIWETGPSGWAGKGIWATDGSNPFGRIPVVLLRSAEPAPGEIFVDVPEDMVDAQRAVNHDYTSLGDWGRKQGFAQAYAKGLTQQQANELEVGPEEMIGIPKDGEFGFASPKPDFAGFGGQLDSFVKLFIACCGLSPATVMKSTGITALAKVIENIEREVERQTAKEEFDAGEQDLYDLCAQASQIQSGGLPVLPQKVIVEVDHREPVTPADPVSDAQAKSTRIDLLLECAASIIATERSIPLDVAQKIALDNLRRQQELEKARTIPTTPAPSTTGGAA